MALSGTIPVSVTGTNSVTAEIRYREVVDNVNNQSTIYANLYYTCPSGAGYPYSGNKNSSNLWLKIGTTTFTDTDGFICYRGQGATAVFSEEKSVVIDHNSDGTGSVVISGGGSVPNTSGIQDSSGSATITLSTIARETIWRTNSGATIGSAKSLLVTTRAARYHKLVAALGSITETKNYTSASGTGDTSLSWTPSNNFLTALPTSMSGTVTLTLTTQSNSSLTNQIGSSQVTSITLSVPSSAKPTSLSIVASEANTTVSTALGSVGYFLQNLSLIKFTVGATAPSGASIASQKVNFNNQNKSGTATSQNFGSVSITGSSLTATLTATDSRGQTAQATTTVNVQAYSSPVISKFTAVRNETTPTTVNTTFTCSVSPIPSPTNSKNRMTVKIKKGSTVVETPQDSDTTISASADNSSGQQDITGVTATSSYVFTIVVTDIVGGEATRSTTVPTSAIAFDVRDGKVGIGKYWENGALDVNGQIHSNDSIYLTKASAGRISIRNAASSPTINFGLHLGATFDHGLYDFVAGKWMIYADSNGDVKLDGGKTPYYTTDGSLVTTGSQSFSGAKTFGSTIYVSSSSGVYGNNDPIWQLLRTSNNAASERLGCVFANVQTVNSKHVMNKLYFREYSYNSTSGDSIAYWDQYTLPPVDANKSSSSTYEILTSKTAVAVDQGGTGATTAADARTNLGIGFDVIYNNSTGKSSAISFTLADYALVVVIGKLGGSANQVSVVCKETGGYKMVDEGGSGNYYIFNLSSTGIGARSGGNGVITQVYGLKIG